MLRPKSVVCQSRVTAVVAPLALLLSMSISHQALANCLPQNTGGTTSVSANTTDVTCDANNDAVTVQPGIVVSNDITLGDGTNSLAVQAGAFVGHDIIGGIGVDTITITDATVGRGPAGTGPNTGTISTGDQNDIVNFNGGHVQHINMGAGNDALNQTEGEIHGSVQMGDGADRVEIWGGEVHSINMGNSNGSGTSEDRIDFEGSHGEEVAIEGSTTVIQGGSGDHRMRLIGLNNLEEDEENFEINANAKFDGGTSAGDRDQFIIEDDSEVRLANQILNFEYFSVQEESIGVLTGTNYKFSPASAVGPNIGINVDGDSQLWFSSSAVIETPHIEVRAANGAAQPLKVSNQYAAFDPGGMLMFGVMPPEEGDDDDDAGEPGEPVNTTLNIGPSTLVNNGTVGTLNGIVGDTVTVNGGPYIAASAAAKMVIDTQLGGSNSPTDRFNFTFAGPGAPVQGNTTTIYVNNVGGIGGFTGQGPTDGIVIVSAPAGFAPNAFQLGVNQLTGRQEVLAGAFSYRLFNSPTAALLQSDILDQVPGYAIVSSVAQRYASAGLGTLYKRMGEVRLGRGDGKTIGNAGAGMWVRGFYNDSDVSPETGFAFSQENQGVMGGADIDLGSSAGGHFLAGAFGGYGTADAGTSARIWGVNSPSTVDLTAYTFGFYGSYYDVGRPGTGLYVDGVFKVDITDFDIASSVRASSASTDGYTSTVSGETGYGFNLGGNLTLQPQAQLSYISVSNQNYQDNYGVKVGSGVGESLVGRASLQLQGNYGSASGGWFAPYAIASVLSDFLGDNETMIGRTPFKNDMGLTWYEAGGGVTAELGEFVSLYGSAEYSFGDIEGWGGTGGVKARW